MEVLVRTTQFSSLSKVEVMQHSETNQDFAGWRGFVMETKERGSPSFAIGGIGRQALWLVRSALSQAWRS